MRIRDAVEADAERLAELTGAPTDVMRNLVHDRTVRVADRGSIADTQNVAAAASSDGSESPSERAVAGFVSFDAKPDTVHISQVEGTPAALERLLKEPTRFASQERMSVEMLVAVGETSKREAAEAAGFTEIGSGPRFAGTSTLRYRLEPP